MHAIADYTELRPHGSGDHATSYLATPPARLDVPGPVVLKVLAGTLRPEQREPVIEELQLFAGVDSPHVMRLLDAGCEDGRLFYAVEHLGRGTLAEPAGELERSGILKVAADAARGAHALHERGIAHGAISPDAVVLHDEGAKLADLDLGRFVNPGTTVPSAAPVASLEYVDPAVVEGGRPGRASDIWSLGVTLHRAVTGRSVYGEDLQAGNLLGAVHRLLSTRPQVAEGTEAAVADIVTACLALDPDERPPTALAVAERLEELL